MWNVNRGDTLPAAHRSVKSQVCQLVHVIRKSLVHIAAIFGQRQSVDGRQSEWVGQRRSSNGVEAVDRVTVCHMKSPGSPPPTHTQHPPCSCKHWLNSPVEKSKVGGHSSKYSCSCICLQMWCWVMQSWLPLAIYKIGSWCVCLSVTLLRAFKLV